MSARVVRALLVSSGVLAPTVMCSGAPASAAPVIACPSIDAVRWTPSAPSAGTLFQVRIAPVSESQITQITTARVSGEPLHFVMQGDSALAFAAAPVDSGAGLSFEMLCADGTRAEVRIATAVAEYPLERLRVAPRFGAPPDSAIVARQRRESARAAAVSRTAHTTPRLWTEPFLAPRSSRITSGFGSGRVFNTTVTSRHMGTDYAGAVGAPVLAANRGVVRLVDAFYLGGNVIYLDHGAGFVTAYLHLSKQLVAEGDTVSRGAVIGHVGATGRVTGPHLHFITRYGGITVDAASVIGVQ